MEFMLVFMEPGAGDAAGRTAPIDPVVRELEAEGTLRARGNLNRDVGTRIRVRDGKADVRNGPVVENGELVSGMWIVDVADRAAAIDIARRCALATDGAIEVHAVMRRDFAHAEIEERPFLFLFRMEPGLTDPDGAKLEEMLDFHEELRREGKLVNTAPLDAEPPPARIRSRAGKVVVTDGPFAETKEGVGGYSIVGAPSYDAAVELGARMPHARWGPVEVRELI